MHLHMLDQLGGNSNESWNIPKTSQSEKKWNMKIACTGYERFLLGFGDQARVTTTCLPPTLDQIHLERLVFAV